MATQTKKRTPLFFIAVIFGALIGFCVFCLAVSSAMDALGMLPTATPSITPSITPLPTQTGTPAPPTATLEPITQIKTIIADKLGTVNRGEKSPRLTEFNWDPAAGILTIKFMINDNFTSDFIMVGMQTDVTDMLKIISQSGVMPEYTMVVFDGTFSLRDNFGNTFEDTVLVAQYNKTTVDKINWDGFLYTDIFTIADGVRIHPAMTAP